MDRGGAEPRRLGGGLCHRGKHQRAATSQLCIQLAFAISASSGKFCLLHPGEPGPRCRPPSRPSNEASPLLFLLLHTSSSSSPLTTYSQLKSFRIQLPPPRRHLWRPNPNRVPSSVLFLHGPYPSSPSNTYLWEYLINTHSDTH